MSEGWREHSRWRQQGMWRHVEGNGVFWGERGGKFLDSLRKGV